MSSSNLITCVALAAACLTGYVVAEDLGAVGPVYEIAERDAIVAMKAKMEKLQKSGKLDKLSKEARNRVASAAKSPTPVDGIGTVLVPSSRLIDPTVVYSEPVKTETGQVILPAGARINPLESAGLTKTLVFFDGRDSHQVSAVAALVKKHGSRVKPVLVAGNWFDLSKEWNAQVYFDQKGTLSKRWGIKAVPAVVTQHGNRLLVREVPAKELT